MESPPVKRRLTAILAADAVGYSSHMAEDEERTLRTLAGHRQIIGGLITSHDGRIVGTAGDSVLAEFGSSVEAVRCAVEIQEALATRNELLTAPERLQFRIGVNLGDVIVEGNDILGDGVNVAARLESIAEPGGVCISSSVFDQITGKLNLGFVDLGEQSLKNIARPVRAYRFTGSTTTASTASGAPKTARTDAPAAKRSATAWIVAAALVLVAAGAAAYGLGVFGGTMPQTATQTPGTSPAATPPVTPAPAAASDAMKLQLQIAEAERAKAEADLARVRAETFSRPQPSTDAKAAATPAPQAPSSPAAFTHGTAEGVCQGQGNDEPELSVRADVGVMNGNVVITWGTPGRPGYLMLRGPLTADGSLVMTGTFVGRAGRSRGAPEAVRYEGHLTNGRGTLTGHRAGRACTVTIQLE